MKIVLKILMLMVIIKVNAQPSFQPPTIKIGINKNNILSDDFRDKYLVSIKTFSDTLYYEAPIDSDFYLYKNNKNYHKFENVGNNYVFFYLKNLSANEIIRLSFFDKKNNEEMNIYFRIEARNLRNLIDLDNISFYEGSYFYDMCDKCRYKTEYINLDYEESIVKVNNIPKHKIRDKKLQKLLKKNKCK